jgi:23S rRNA (guanosine2251-2'-O)-methyltransferase
MRPVVPKDQRKDAAKSDSQGNNKTGEVIMKKRSQPAPKPEEFIVGRQAVLEALKYNRLHRVYIMEGQQGAIVESIVSQAGKNKTPLSRLSRGDFAALVKDIPGHQGVAALAPPFRYMALSEMIKGARAASPLPFLLLLDHLQDPQNLGSIIRTADAAGVYGLIIPDLRAAKVTTAVRKVAAGAVERSRIAVIQNISRTIETLKQEGFWIYGAEADGQTPYYQADYKVPLALVVGSEGKGISRIVREHCDQTLSIPMQEEAASLNVAVASAVLIFAALAQRQGWVS